MITISIQNDETGHVRSRDPQMVEAYVGAMEAYVKWRLPEKVAIDQIRLSRTELSADAWAETAASSSRCGNPQFVIDGVLRQ